MLTLAEIQRRLEDCNIKAVAQKVGIHENTLYRLGDKTSYKTVELLSNYFEDRESSYAGK